MHINLNNVEDIIFYDKNVQRVLPDMSSLFQQWSLGKQIPHLKQMSQRAILDFFERVTERHVAALSEYFNEEVILKKFDSHIARNCSTPLGDAEEYMNLSESFVDFAISRDVGRLYVCFWK